MEIATEDEVFSFIQMPIIFGCKTNLDHGDKNLECGGFNMQYVTSTRNSRSLWHNVQGIEQVMVNCGRGIDISLPLLISSVNLTGKKVKVGLPNLILRK